MKKTKLLFPIIGVPALMATLIPTVVSCNPTPIDPTDEEEIIMPDKASETKYAYEEEYGAYSYVVIRGCEWISPQHEYDELYAEALIDEETSLPTEIIPKNDNTFDVKVMLLREENCYESETNLSFNLTITAYNEETGEDEPLSDTKQYSMKVEQHIHVTNAIYEPNSLIPIEFQLYILNGENHITVEPLTKESIKISGFPETMGIKEDSIAGTIETNEYYCCVNIQFALNNPTEIHYDGLDLNLTIKLNSEEGETLPLTQQFNGYSRPIIIGNYEEISKPIKILKKDNKVYEGDSYEGSFEWFNPEEGKTAGDLFWKFEQEQLDEYGIKSIEVTPTTQTEKAVHFKFTMNDVSKVGETFELSTTVLYKDMYKEIKSNIVEHSFPFVLGE